MTTEILNTPIEYLKGVGTTKAEVLKKELGIAKFGDLLSHYPFRYVDRSQYFKLADLNADLPYVQFIARVVQVETIGEKSKKRLVATVKDDTAEIELVWFQGSKLVEKLLKIGGVYIFFGKPSIFNHSVQVSHPEIELYSKEILEKRQNQKLQPIYNTTEKLKQFYLDSKGIQKLIENLFEQMRGHHFAEFIPQGILDTYHLMEHNQALYQIHFPASHPLLQKSLFRLKFEELFLIQLKLLSNKVYRTQKYKGHIFSKVGDVFNVFYQQKLPFALTEAQKRVLKEIRQNTQTGVQMNRLLQGDVGSGKTVVALLAMLLAIDNGFQTCMMAPTEILAQQHFNSIKELLGEDFVSIALLTGSTSRKDRKMLLDQLAQGTLKILVGTHALIEDTVQFQNLGLAIIDEQHRFGVEQRAKLWQKNTTPPHILVMTATPIPRTLAMTLYGDLDVSVINELPKGRKPIQTIHLYESQRLRMFGLMRQEIAKQRQVYVVYPLIQESEKIDLLNLMQGFEHLSQEFPLPDYRISIVHGKLKPEDKDFEMQRFVKGETQIMIATTVIEVGVNVPNACLMIIENAERFGLAQLHQLRGRVGRGAEQSYCVLMSGDKLSKDARTRLDTMVRTNDGFEISEIDLQLRGPGNLDGTQQSGVLDLKIADLAKDQMILQEARQSAEYILKQDPQLYLPENQNLKQILQTKIKTQNWHKIS